MPKPTGIITGGGLHPQIAARMAQEKEQQNRLLLAIRQQKSDKEIALIREKGAGQRQVQNIAAQQMLENLDRTAKSAEAEDKRIFDKAEADDQRVFTEGENELDRKSEIARDKEDYKNEMLLQEMGDISREEVAEKQAATMERYIDTVADMADKSDAREYHTQEMEHALTRARESHTEERGVYDRQSARLVEFIDADPNLDLPIKGEVGADGSIMGPSLVSSVQKAWDRSKVPVEVMGEEGVLTTNGFFLADRMKNLMDKGLIDKEDIKAIGMSLNSVVAVGETRRGLAGGDEDKLAFWTWELKKVRKIRRDFEDLALDTKSIGAEGSQTIRKLMLDGLSLGRHASFGSVATWKQEYIAEHPEYKNATEWSARPREVPELYPITEDMHPYRKKIRERRNRSLIEKYPHLAPPGLIK